MTDSEKISQIKNRIAIIDQMFEEATGWGSWMSEVSGERRGLVRQLRVLGVEADDKFVLRTASGAISD